MTTASAQLEAAIYSLLTADSILTDLLGGVRIYAHPKRNAAFPYITLTTAQSRDWSTGTEEGEEHRLTLNIWAERNDYQRMQSLLARITTLLKNAVLVLTDHHLVNLRHLSRETRQDRRNQALQGILQIRAVTEPKLI